jgi:hypothetical protein
VQTAEIYRSLETHAVARTRAWLALVLLSACFFALGCSASSGTAAFDQPPPAGTSTTLPPGAPMTMPTGTATAVNPTTGPGLSGGIGSRDQADAAPCAATTHQGEVVPLDIFVIWDRSGSMDDQVNGGRKWDQVVAAFEAFVNDPQSAGIGVGIQYFPLTAGSSSGSLPDDHNTSCNIPDYSIAAVPIAPLPDNATPILASIHALSPAGRTPTRVALEGAIDYARTWATQHPERKVIVLLQTDGQPNVCNSTVQAVSDVAATGMNGTPSIPTYVIGVGTELQNLDQIAQAGGTAHAFIVDTSQNTTQQFIDAMNSIRGSAGMPCDFLIPPGAAVDFAKVNVTFTPPGAGAPFQLLNAPTEADCDPVTGGWFYDNPAQPTRIRLCKSSCDAVTAQTNGRLDVLLGCSTNVTVH